MLGITLNLYINNFYFIVSVLDFPSTDKNKGEISMSEENIKRIEKKIDVLYKIVSGIGGLDVENPISDIDYLDELIPLFNISIDTKLFEEYEKVKKLLIIEFEKEEEVKKKLDKLENDYRTGNFLEKEKGKIREMVSNQKEKYKALGKMAEHLKRVVYDKKEFRRSFLWLNLGEKLGKVSSENYIENKKEFEKGFKGAIDGLYLDLKEYKRFK